MADQVPLLHSIHSDLAGTRSPKQVYFMLVPLAFQEPGVSLSKVAFSLNGTGHCPVC